MSWFSNILHTAAPLVSAVASSVPGGKLLGAIAGGISSLDAAGNANKKANNVNNQIQGNADFLTNLVDPYYAPILQSLMGRVNQSQAPLTAGPAGDPFGLTAAVNNNNPYSTAGANSNLAGVTSRTARAYQNAADLTRGDLATSGLKYSSALPGALTANRLQQAQATASAGNEYAQKGAEYKASTLQNADNETWNRILQLNSANRADSQQGIGNLLSALSSISSIRGQGIGSLGGLQQLYNSQAAGAGNNFATALGTLAQTGIFDNLFGTNKRPSNAGDSKYGTNQAGTTYIPSAAAQMGLDQYTQRRV